MADVQAGWGSISTLSKYFASRMETCVTLQFLLHSGEQKKKQLNNPKGEQMLDVSGDVISLANHGYFNPLYEWLKSPSQRH